MRSQRDDSTIAAPSWDEVARAMGHIKWSSWVWHAICRHHTENCRNSSFQSKLHLGRVSLAANDMVSTFLSSKYAPQLTTWSKESTSPNLMVSTGLDLDLFIVVDTCIYKRDDINLQTFDGSLTPQPVSIAVRIMPSSEGMSSPMLLMYLSTPPAENVRPPGK